MYAVAVIVPTYRREAPLVRCLGDVLAQRHPAFEVIVVDQTPAHEPATRDYLAALPPHARVLRLPRPSVTAAANAGARAARAPVLVFLDDDVEIPDRDFLARHERHYADPTIGAVVGRIRHADGAGAGIPPAPADGALAFLDMNFDHGQPMDVPTLAGANMSCRAALLRELGGFDEGYVGNAFRWETDFSLRVRARGFRLRYDPEAAVVHHYGTPGGCDNVHLSVAAPGAFAYYTTFFRNNAYFAARRLEGAARRRFTWRLYREHVLNRGLLRRGPLAVAGRHAAFLLGGWAGRRAARAAARDA